MPVASGVEPAATMPPAARRRERKARQNRQQDRCADAGGQQTDATWFLHRAQTRSLWYQARVATLPTLASLDVDNRRVFVRVDFNVPLRDGEIQDDARIQAALPTLVALRSRGAILVVASHLGRPKGVPDPAFSMEPVAAHLAVLLENEVRLPDEVVGESATKLVKEAHAGDIVMLQNLRFHPGETKNDPAFADALAKLCDLYVCDAFGACHRAHASVDALPRKMRHKAAGHLLLAEIDALSQLVEAPPRPFVAIIGGAKVSDKLGVLIALSERFKKGDTLIIGGAMANTFLAATGTPMGNSLQEPDRYADCKTVLAKAEARGVNVVLPRDLVCAKAFDATSGQCVDAAEGVPDEQMALDVGPRTLEACAPALAAAKTVFWNGPLGRFESPAFASGTLSMAKLVAQSPGYTVVGGGDSVAALHQSGCAREIDHISTGGGASLEFIEGRMLPGIAALLT